MIILKKNAPAHPLCSHPWQQRSQLHSLECKKKQICQSLFSRRNSDSHEFQMLWCSKEPTWLASRTKNTNKKRSSFCECFHYLLFNMWHWGAAIESSKAQNIKSSLSPPKFQSARATNKNRFSFLLFSFSQSLLKGKKKGHLIGKSHYFLRSLLPIALELRLSEILTRELFFTVTFLTCFEVHLFWGLWSHPLRKKHFDYSPLLRH